MSILNHFQHLNLSQSQETALNNLEAFFVSPVQVFMLKGYAGSGKTTILKGLVEYLDATKKEFVLMAPTGRAAIVIREKTGKEAYTIHKSIYSYEDLVELEDGESFFYYYKIRNNEDIKGTIFIVDEASMISDMLSEGEFFRFGTGHLLSDLITYSRVQHNAANTKIIFVGDPCQLPPVSDIKSRAFDKEYLHEKFKVDALEAEMKEVMRHGGGSGILTAATKIRKCITSGYFNCFNLKHNEKDILQLEYEELLNSWESKPGTKVIVAYKNKTCLDMNIQIRERRFGNGQLPIRNSDIIILGANNYSKGVFNGEFGVVNEVDQIPVSRTIALKGKSPVTLVWRTVELVFPDAETEQKVVKGKMLENFLWGDNVLRPEEMQALYVDFAKRNPRLKPKSKEFKEAIKQDDFFNCLKLKFGYAVTCHKAQGGEWDSVFTIWDHDNRESFDYLSDTQARQGKDNEMFYRWAYTAVTRAAKTLYVLNPPSFSSYTTMTSLEPEVVKALGGVSGKPIPALQLELTNERLDLLKYFGLLDQPLPIQDSFLAVQNHLAQNNIEISGWERKNMEIVYRLKRESASAGLKTWFNKDVVFNGKYMAMPALTNSAALYSEAEALLKALPKIAIKRNTADTIISQITFDNEVAEKYPFTNVLFDDLMILFEGTGIVIESIAHFQYKERYNFKRSAETAIIDFEYSGNGFWGRVYAVSAKTTSYDLVRDIQTLLKTLQHESHAV